MNISRPSTTSHSIGEALAARLDSRIDLQASAFLTKSISEVAAGTSKNRFAELFSICNRYTRRRIKLNLSMDELNQVKLSPNTCNPKDWNLLDTMRISLLLAWPQQQNQGSFDEVYEHCFRFADEGEACALYRALPLLIENQGAEKRFLKRATEGCRSNMQSVFEAVACDSNYAFLHFDSLSWHQLIMKALFIDSPLWRVLGLDDRLSDELSRMVQDLVDEKRSANRSIPPQLWLCFGKNVNEDILALMQEELAACVDEASAKALIFALARAGYTERAKQLVDLKDAEIAQAITLAEQGKVDQSVFANL